jgi:hypothetical protein
MPLKTPISPHFYTKNPQKRAFSPRNRKNLRKNFEKSPEKAEKTAENDSFVSVFFKKQKIAFSNFEWTFFHIFIYMSLFFAFFLCKTSLFLLKKNTHFIYKTVFWDGKKRQIA